MYKNRAFLWAVLFLIYFTFTSMQGAINEDLIHEKQEVRINFQTDTEIKSTFSSYDDWRYEFLPVYEDFDIIIRDSSDDDIYGFEKLDSYLYSPILLYAPRYMEKPEDMFSSFSANIYYANLKNITDAVIQSKTIGELGITDDKKYSNNVIKLALPTEGTMFYQQTMDAIYTALNGNRIPTQQEYENLRPYVEQLQETSIKCNNISGSIGDLEYGDYVIFIGPEFVTKNCSRLYSASQNGYWHYAPIYFEQPSYVKYDILVRSGIETDIRETVMEAIIENKDLCKFTKIRTTALNKYHSIFSPGAYILD